MKKTFLILTLGLFFFSCGEKEVGQTATEDNNTTAIQEAEEAENIVIVEEESETNIASQTAPRGTIYRSDGFHPGVASEWIQVAYNDEHTKIDGIWFWTTNNEEKVQMEILEQEIISGDEIGGAVGKIRYPGSDFMDDFGIIEDIFVITDSDGRRQEFDYEGYEE